MLCHAPPVPDFLCRCGLADSFTAFVIERQRRKLCKDLGTICKEQQLKYPATLANYRRIVEKDVDLALWMHSHMGRSSVVAKRLRDNQIGVSMASFFSISESTMCASWMTRLFCFSVRFVV